MVNRQLSQSEHGYGPWKQVTLGEFITLQRGHDLPEHSRKPGTVPVLGSFGITGYHSEAIAKGPGVTVGRSGASFGVVSFCNDDFWPLNTALYVVDFHGSCARFAYYLLKSLDFTRFNSGSAQPSLNRNFIHPIPVKIPPYAEQVAIAELLGALDDKIEINRRTNETLETIARAIFKSWFLDFEIRSVREELSLAGVPRGWQTLPLSAIVELLSGGTPKTTVPEYWNGDIPWVSVADTVPGPYIVATEKTIARPGVENSAAKVLSKETIIITARGTVGNTALLSMPMAMNQSCYGVRGRGQVGQLFLFFLLRQQLSILKANTHGSVFETITRSTFDAIEVMKPPDALLKSFENTVRPVFDRILLNQREAATLGELRDALLPKLISGEIRITEAQKIVEAHA